MAYSFTDTVTRSPFSPAVRKIWYTGLALTAIVLAASVGLHFYTQEQQQLAVKERELQQTLSVQVDQLQQQQTHFGTEKMLRQQTYTGNQLAADHIYDLLDLVPDDTTLQHFEMTELTLLYEGESLNFEALMQSLMRAFSGQYRLADTEESNTTGKTHFILRFVAEGEHQ